MREEGGELGKENEPENISRRNFVVRTAMGSAGLGTEKIASRERQKIGKVRSHFELRHVQPLVQILLLGCIYQ
jgi:hypothetical protein